MTLFEGVWAARGTAVHSGAAPSPPNPAATPENRRTPSGRTPQDRTPPDRTPPDRTARDRAPPDGTLPDLTARDRTSLRRCPSPGPPSPGRRPGRPGPGRPPPRPRQGTPAIAASIGATARFSPSTRSRSGAAPGEEHVAVAVEVGQVAGPERAVADRSASASVVVVALEQAQPRHVDQLADRLVRVAQPPLLQHRGGHTARRSYGSRISTPSGSLPRLPGGPDGSGGSEIAVSVDPNASITRQPNRSPNRLVAVGTPLVAESDPQRVVGVVGRLGVAST